MDFQTSPAPHSVASNSVQRVMGLVLLALIPGTLVYVSYFGWGLLIHMSVAVLSALLSEALCLRLRRQRLNKFLYDGSAVLTAVLLAFALPPLAPWWLTASGAAFGIVFAKHVYGGLGYNLFNPAMVGFAALLVSFPSYMSAWPVPDTTLSFVATLAIVFVPIEAIDAISQATPLMTMRNELKLGATMSEITAGTLFGNIAGVGWEWIAVAFAGGGIGLLALRVIRWHVPIAMLSTMLIFATTMHAVDPGTYAGPVFHLFSGASMLGAFFIATDPISCATSNRGRLIFGSGVGALTYIIRTWGGYAEGVAFAVLLMNAAAPLIDRYTIPRIYGHPR
ncbi:MAG: RnfABCDGE type electron transport complex subunit D [Candidatus Obscuribacterales bacterium]|nr:RnfABCDGE type electron transport complex subunit D [Steroidobacteraceae bacterium]